MFIVYIRVHHPSSNSLSQYYIRPSGCSQAELDKLVLFISYILEIQSYVMDHPYKLLEVGNGDPIPNNYRLLTVAEVLKKSEEITKFLVYHENGIELEELSESDDDCRSEIKDELMLMNEEYDEIIEGDEESSDISEEGYLQPKRDYEFQFMEDILDTMDGQGENMNFSNQNQPIEFLVYEKYGDDSCAGFARFEISQNKDKFEEQVHMSQMDSQNEDILDDGKKRLEITEVELFDEKYDNDALRKYPSEHAISRSVIAHHIPHGYRLASKHELWSCYKNNIGFLAKIAKLKIGENLRDVWLVLRKIGVLRMGEDQDIQDFCGTYFSFETKPRNSHAKIRLKNGFIDGHRRLVWKEFTRHDIEQMLVVHCDHIKDTYELKDNEKVVALLFACFLEDTKEIEDILNYKDCFKIMKTNDPNAPSGGSAIHLCAAQGSLDCLEKLFEKLSENDRREACIAKADVDGITPLSLALQWGKAEVVDRLCTDKSINARTKKEKLTPLMIVTRNSMQNKGLWKPLLAQKGLDLNEVNKMKSNVFHIIANFTSHNFTKKSHAVLLNTLLEKCGCRVSDKVYRAAGKKKLPTHVIKEVAMLHRQNSEHTLDDKNQSYVINQKNKRLLTPLHCCLNMRTLRRAIDIANVDYVNDEHDFSFDNSDDEDDDLNSSFQPWELIPIQFSRLLISAGADIMALNKEGQNALHRVCDLPMKDYGMIQIIFRCFIDDQLKDKSSKFFQDAKAKWSKYICSQDFYGQTPLHIAARSGHVEIVRVLLEPVYNNAVEELTEIRDFNDHTILHYVATPPRRFIAKENDKIDIAKQIFCAMSKEVIALTIWSMGQGIGLADSLAQDKKYLRLASFLKYTREHCKENLLGLALKFGNIDMTLELINRNAIITKQMKQHAQIGNLLKKEKKYLDFKLEKNSNENKNVTLCGALKEKLRYGFYEARKEEVELKLKLWKIESRDKPDMDQIKVLEKIKLSHQGRTTDQPTDEDLLDRENIESSITAVLLNQHMGSPITLGILGGTGMGKSSMMMQVEHDLLSKAAKETLMLALPKTSQKKTFEKIFTGAKRESSRSRRYARRILSELHQVIQKIEYNKKSRYFDKKAFDLEKLNELQRDEKSKCYKWNLALKYIGLPFNKIRSIIISFLECEVLLHETMEEKITSYIENFNEDNKWLVKRLALASEGEEVPALMTVRFDAWQYENKDEAWAGLAIEVLKEMERSMTKPQLLYASVMYSIKKNPSYARMNLIFPIIAYLILGGIVGLISYILLSIPSLRTHYTKSLKFGSILVSVFLSVWKVLSQVLQYAKPISDKVAESTRSLQEQHLSKVGYQHQVMEDINFLRDRMTFQDIPMWHLWKLGAFILNISSSSSFLATPVEASDALKHIPLRESFRIIVFIDNLDRQKEKLFTPLNMILKSCNLNAVVAMDKESIDTEDIFEETPENIQETPIKIKLARKDILLKQLIQIPIILPEPNVYELNNTFLKHHLKDMRKQKRKPKSIESMTPKVNQRSSFPTFENIEAPSREDRMTATTSEISIETLDPSLHQGTCVSLQMSPTNDSPPRQYEMKKSIIHSTQPSKETTTEGTYEDEESQENEKTKKKGKQHNAWAEMKLNVLDSNYSRGEIEVFKHLSKHTYGYYRSPPAWKSLLNYHRLIRSLLSYDDISHFRAWRRQLVIWVFLCWQWKDQMNDIFKYWTRLSSFSLQELEQDNLLVDLQDRQMLVTILKHDYQLYMLKKKRYEHLWDHINFIYPTISRIIGKHIKEKSKAGNNGKGNSTKVLNKSTNNDASSSIGQAPISEKGSNIKEVTKNMKEQEEDDDEEDEEKEEVEVDNEMQGWGQVSKAFEYGRYDLNMQSMQLFQKYRFDCHPGFLKMCVRN